MRTRWMIGVAVLLMVAPGPALAKTTVYRALMNMPANADQLAPLQLLMEEGSRLMEREDGIAIDLTLTARGKNVGDWHSYDFLFTTGREAQKGYSPLAGLVIFRKKLVRHCVYVKKDSATEGLKQLRNTTAMIMDSIPSYYSLRRLLGEEAPEKFFEELQVTKGLHSGLIALAFGEVDAAYALDIEVAEMEFANPAIAAKVRPLVCAKEGFPPPPVWVRDTVSRTDARKVRSFLLSMHKHKDLGRYKGFMDLIGLRFIPYDPKLDEDVQELLTLAEKKGWRKDHARWLGYARGDVPH